MVGWNKIIGYIACRMMLSSPPRRLGYVTKSPYMWNLKEYLGVPTMERGMSQFESDLCAHESSPRAEWCGISLILSFSEFSLHSFIDNYLRASGDGQDRKFFLDARSKAQFLNTIIWREQTFFGSSSMTYDPVMLHETKSPSCEFTRGIQQVGTQLELIIVRLYCRLCTFKV